MATANYLLAGKASDLDNHRDRILFRLFEILPGALSWGALFLAFLFSWWQPFWVSIFIICFSFYWLFRTVYFSFHLASGYKKMKEYEKINWIEKLNKLENKNWREFYHLVVIPTYKEPLAIIKDAFDCLDRCDYPKDRMIVVLACEERTRDFAQNIAQEIKKEFGAKFFKFLITWHPVNLPGEMAGKGSNETWGVKEAKATIIDPLKIPYEKIIFSSFDADTCIFPRYFSCLTYAYLTCKKPARTSFQPVPLYVNNIWQAPVISRVFSFSSTFWHTINQERPEKLITFSSHSMSFQALVDIGFKQTNIVSDDSRVFWQCFFRYDGDYQVQPLYYPVSMDANVATNFFQTMINIYKQQKRWAYGVGDIPYFLLGFLKNKKIPLKRKLSLAHEVMGGHFSWAVASILIFLLGWLPLMLGGVAFSHSVLFFSLPNIVSKIMTMAMIGLVASCYLSLILLPPRPPDYGKYKYFIFAFSWLLAPILMIFFFSLPALDAQTRWMFGKYMGFWPTEKVRK